MLRTVSIRSGLLGTFALVIVLLSGAILTTAYSAARRTIETASRVRIEGTLTETENRLKQFFDPISRDLLVARGWGQEGVLDLDDDAQLNLLFAPLLKQRPQVSSLLIADERGHEHMLTRNKAQWTTRLSRPSEWSLSRKFIEWTDDRAEPSLREEEDDYDPRERPWYRGACAIAPEYRDLGSDLHCIHWTPPYEFYTGRQPGLTASTAFHWQGRRHVVAFDVLIDEISLLTTSLELGERGMVLVTTGDAERVIGLPRHKKFDDPDDRRGALLRSPLELKIPAITDALEVAARRDDAFRGPIRFRSGDEPWYGDARLMEISPNFSVYVAVVVPEADLIDDLATRRLRILVVTGVVLVLVLFVVLVVSRRFSGPIEALVAQSDRISQGDLEPIGPVDSIITEFRQLAEAHERMRVGLSSLMRIERDLQLARRIQKRTMPERLPQVPGFEIAAWNDPADETGGDAFDVIGYCLDESGTARITHEAAEHVIMLLADATGHGIGPALSVTQLRSMLRMGVRTRQPLLGFARHMNRQLAEDLPEGRFITAWMGQLDARRSTLKSFSAGQAPLIHYCRAEDRFEVSDADTVPFGLMPEMQTSNSHPIELGDGDIFAVLSDGIFEARNSEKEQFGRERVTDIIRAHRNETAADVLVAIRQALGEFTRPAVVSEDDQTAIIIRKTPPSEASGTT